MASLFSKPAETPVTMFCSNARVVPHAARANLVSLVGLTTRPSDVSSTLTASIRSMLSSPLGPLAVTVRPLIVIVTPLTGATGFLPVRDILVQSLSNRLTADPRPQALEHAAEYLATNIGSLGFVIGHHTLGGGEDRYTEAVGDLRNILHRGINPTARTRNALDRADDTFIVRVLQFDFVLGGTVLELGLRIAADETLGLEHIQHATTQGRSRSRNGILATLLGVTDTGQHVADGIGKAHLLFSLPARLHETRDLAQVTQLTQSDTAHLQLAIEATGTTRDFAAVADADLGGVARQLGQLELGGETLIHGDRLVLGLCLESGALGSKLLGERGALVVLHDGAGLCHILILYPFPVRLLAEGEVECLEQRTSFIIRLRGRRDHDVHAPNLIDLIVVDLGENDVFLDTHGVVATAVEGVRVQPAEVANTRQRDVHQAVEKFVHAGAAQSDLHAERHFLTHLEASDRLASVGEDRLLASDLFHLGSGRLDLLGVGDGFANAHVQHDLLELGHLHDVLVGELLLQRLADVAFVLGTKARNVSCLSHRSNLRSTWRRASSRRP